MEKFKTLEELTEEELKKVFTKNSELREDVCDDAMEGQDDYIRDILDCFPKKAINYSISRDGYGNYMDVLDNDLFLDGLKAAQSMYCALEDSYAPVIGKLSEKLSIFFDMDYDNKNYEPLEHWLDIQCQMLCNTLLKMFRKMYDYYDSEENCLEYFLDFYKEERMSGEFYIDKEYVLYQHIEYEKKYV